MRVKIPNKSVNVNLLVKITKVKLSSSTFRVAIRLEGPKIVYGLFIPFLLCV